MINQIKIPNNILRKIKNAMPSYPSGVSTGRYPGVYTESGDDASSYKSVIIYVQNGLADKFDLFKSIAKAVFKIQEGGTNKYPVLVFGFGDTEHLQHENKFFDFGYTNDAFNSKKVADTISRISGKIKVNPAVIPTLYPKTDARSLYKGKSKVTRDDLLIIIGNKEQIFFDKKLENKMNQKIKNNILQVELDNDNIIWIFKKININYK